VRKEIAKILLAGTDKPNEGVLKYTLKVIRLAEKHKESGCADSIRKVCSDNVPHQEVSSCVSHLQRTRRSLPAALTASASACLAGPLCANLAPHSNTCQGCCPSLLRMHYDRYDHNCLQPKYA
jgi:hypothetical protein